MNTKWSNCSTKPLQINQLSKLSWIIPQTFTIIGLPWINKIHWTLPLIGHMLVTLRASWNGTGHSGVYRHPTPHSLFLPPKPLPHTRPYRFFFDSGGSVRNGWNYYSTIVHATPCWVHGQMKAEEEGVFSGKLQNRGPLHWKRTSEFHFIMRLTMLDISAHSPPQSPSLSAFSPGDWSALFLQYSWLSRQSAQRKSSKNVGSYLKKTVHCLYGQASAVLLQSWYGLSRITSPISGSDWADLYCSRKASHL